jgi:hypothetical protein
VNPQGQQAKVKIKRMRADANSSLGWIGTLARDFERGNASEGIPLWASVFDQSGINHNCDGVAQVARLVRGRGHPLRIKPGERDAPGLRWRVPKNRHRRLRVCARSDDADDALSSSSSSTREQTTLDVWKTWFALNERAGSLSEISGKRALRANSGIRRRSRSIRTARAPDNRGVLRACPAQKREGPPNRAHEFVHRIRGQSSALVGRC